MTTRPLALLAVTTLAGCATTKSFEFPTESSRQCFAPCESQHTTCKYHCGAHGVHHSHESSGSVGVDALGLALDVVVHLDCIGVCNAALERCAAGCGGRQVGGARVPASGPVSSDARQRELRIKLLKADGVYDGMVATCNRLYAATNARAIKVAGRPREECPPKNVFVDFCMQLKHETARCLLPEVAAKEKDDCKEALQDEELVPASNMNAVLGRCYPRKKATSQPASQPTSRPTKHRAPPAKQSADEEHPPKK
jgi:hypothetical protein